MTDTMIREVLDEYQQALASSLPQPSDCTHTFSPEFLHKMKALNRRMNATSAPAVWKRVACAVLVLVLFAGCLLALHPDVRATVVTWIKKQFEIFQVYQHAGAPGATAGMSYDIGWFPENCERVEQLTSPSGGAVVYRNEQGVLIYLTYILSADENMLYVDVDGLTHTTAIIAGQQADIYLSADDCTTNNVIWEHPDTGVLLHLSAPYDLKVLIAISESVFSVK